MLVGFPLPREAAASARMPCSVIRGTNRKKLGHLVPRQTHAKSGLAGRFVFAAERTGKLDLLSGKEPFDGLPFDRVGFGLQQFFEMCDIEVRYRLVHEFTRRLSEPSPMHE
jgi:hypothetical protein